MTNRTALITGATGGLGRAFAAALAARGHDLVLVARRQAELEQVAAEARERHGVAATVLPCDLDDRAARTALLAGLGERGPIDTLVNNAGFGRIGPFAAESERLVLGQCGVNVEALTHVAHAVLPGMLERRSGAIINVASTAAFQPLPNMAVYAATKAYVKSWSQALWSETKGTGVRVVALCPGPTQTGFFDAAGNDAVMAWRRAPEQVVATALRAVDRNKAVAVDGVANRIMAYTSKTLPFPPIERFVKLIAR